MARGDAEHRRFLHEGEPSPGARGPCFIATLVYGEGREVMVLRRFRDRVLRASPIGRGLILAYYRTAPSVCRVLAGHPVLIGAMRLMLRPFVWGADRMVSREGGVVFEWAIAVILAAVLLAWTYRLRRRPENAWMPRELRRATLAYAEQLFKAPGRVMLTAKVDRAYRGRSGTLILVELKTRRLDRPYLSDVIELSAQRVAIMRQTGEHVAMHGYVVVQRRPGHCTSHRVALLTEDEIDALIVRWEAIVDGDIQPRRSGAPRLCYGCGFMGDCVKHE